MKKYFLFYFFIGIYCSIYGQSIALTLRTTKGDRIEYVDANIKHLSFNKDYITNIEGLSQLKSLQTIRLDMMAFMEDFSFLQDVPWLITIVIRGVSKTNTDFTFIENMPNLKALWIYFGPHGIVNNGIRFDLKNNKSLELLALHDAALICFPELVNIPLTLRYLSLEGNKIKYLPENFQEFSNIRIFLGANPYKEKKYDNITYDWASDLLDNYLEW